MTASMDEALCEGCHQRPSPQNDCEICRERFLSATASLPSSRHAPQGREFLPGDVLLEKWKLVSLIGHGGMGSVFLAQDLTLNRPVAVKILSSALVADEASRMRFGREAMLTAQLDHPNIVPVLGVGEAEGRPFIAMKLVQGAPLERLLQEKRVWSWAETRRIIAPLLSGLGYIHERGLVHRDVKPANIIVGDDGHVTLLDFGLVKLNTSDSTLPGQLIGTVKYMAPEQILGEQVGPTVDLYAVGILAARMLCGELPFGSDDLAKVARDKIANRPFDPRTLNPKLPVPLAAAVTAALERTPGKRPQSAAALLELFDAATRRPPRRASALLFGIAATTLVLAGVFTSIWAFSGPNPTPIDAGLQRSRAAIDAGPTKVAFEKPDAGADAGTPVEADAGVKKFIRPVRRMGTLKVKVIGDAKYGDVYVDGVFQHDTPLELKLSEGRHTVKVARAGFRTFEKVIVIRADRTEQLELRLRK